MALLKVGALDSFDEPRARTFWRLCRLEAAAGRPEPLLEAQPADFEIGPQAASLPNPKWEHELLGFPVSCHPLQYFAPHLDWRRYVPASHLLSYLGKEVDVCGLIVAERVHPTDRGPMKFLTLADYTGFVEAALFADVYRGFGHLTNHAVVALRATVDPFDNQRGFCLNAHAVRKP
jgi:DNA polymerase III alpha subunit